MASAVVNPDPPPDYDECCTADDASLICLDQGADREPSHQLTRTEQPAPIRYIVVQGHQPFVNQPVLPSPGWSYAVGTLEPRGYAMSPAIPSQLPASTMQLTRRTEQPLPSSAPIVDVDGNELEMFRCQVVFGCIVMWLINFVFGLVAYALASHAEIIKYTEPRNARRYGYCSIAVSVAGIVFTVVVVILLATYPYWQKLTTDSTLSLHG